MIYHMASQTKITRISSRLDRTVSHRRRGMGRLGAKKAQTDTRARTYKRTDGRTDTHTRQNLYILAIRGL